MKYEWDENKNITNQQKHGLNFSDAHEVFEGETFTFEDIRFDYEEQRFVTMGLFRGDVVVIIHTETKTEIRIISMRKAVKNEQKLYFKNVYG